jgi:hypothetical protein
MAFLVPSGPADTKHLCCVLTDAFDGSQRLLITISTIYEGKRHDDACVLSADDHPWLKHPSYVVYRHIEQRSDAHIQKQIEANIFVPREKFDASVLRRIIESAADSEQIKPFAEKILSERNA